MWYYIKRAPHLKTNLFIDFFNLFHGYFFSSFLESVSTVICERSRYRKMNKMENEIVLNKLKYKSFVT